MKATRFISKNFDYIWDRYCTDEIGFKIIGKEEFSSDTVCPIFWGSDNELKVKILIILTPYPSRFVTTVFLWVDKAKYPMRRKVPMRVKSCFKNIGNFHFKKEELKNEDVKIVFENKCKEINDPLIFNKLVATACRTSQSVDNERKSRSVYAIPSGLYGQGKNRRH